MSAKPAAAPEAPSIIWVEPMTLGRAGNRVEVSLNSRGLFVTGKAAELVGMYQWERVRVGWDPKRRCIVLARAQVGGWALVRHERSRGLTVASKRLVAELRRLGVEGRRFAARRDGAHLIIPTDGGMDSGPVAAGRGV